MKKTTLLFSVIFTLLVHLCFAQNDYAAQLLRVPIISKVDNLERDFFLYLPKEYGRQKDKKWPVILFLHGNGERGNGKGDLDYVLLHGPLYEAWIQKRDLPFIIISPQLPMFGMDKRGISYLDDRDKSWIPQRLAEGVPPRPIGFVTPGPMTGAVATDSFPPGRMNPPAGWDWVEKDLLTIYSLVLNNYRADEKRVYLTGISYGAFGAWSLASRHPDKFAAICPVVGWGHPGLMPPIAKAKLPVWAFAGGRDNGTPVKYFYAGLNELEELGHPEVRFTVHEDMGHDVWRRVYGGQDIYDWFLMYSKE